MKVRLRPALLALTLTLTAATTAYAQYEPTDRSRFGLRMSLLRPLDSKLSDLAGAFSSPTIDYNLKFDSNDRPTHFISFTWFAKEENGKRVKLMPLTYNYIRRHFDEEENRGWYSGVGIGLADVSLTGYSGFSRPTESSTNLGISLLGGYEASESWFAEFAYSNFGTQSHPAFGSVNFHGFSVSVGTRIAY